MATLIPRSPGPQVQQQMGPQVRNTVQVDMSPLERTAGIVGGAATQLFQQEKERADTARLMDARTQLSDWVTSIRDPNNPDGLSKYRGEGALNIGPELSGQLDTRIAEIKGNLTRDQQEQFAEIASNFRNGQQEQWATYADGQVRGAIKAKGEAMNLAVTNEAIQYGMTGDFKGQMGALQELAAANDRRDQLDGVPREVTEQNNRSRASEVFRKTAEGILIDDPSGAKRYFDGVRAHMDGADLVATDRSISSKLQALEQKAERDRERAEAKAQRLQDKREAAAQRGITRYEQLTSMGGVASVEMLQKLGELTQGTEMEGEFHAAVQNERSVQTLLQSPPGEQDAYIQREQARLNTSGGTVQELTNLNRLRTAVDNGKKQLQESPLLFNQLRTGMTPAEVDPQGLLSGDPAALAALQENMDTLASMRKQYGDAVGDNPLMPQTAAAISRAMDHAPPEQKLELFAGLQSGIGDLRSYRAVMQQVAPDHPALAYAGMLYSRSPKAARLVVMGESLLNPSKTEAASNGRPATVKMPASGEFDQAFGDLVGNAYQGTDGQGYSVDMQVVRAAYAAAAASDGDVTGVLNSKRLDNVVKATLGEPIEYNGRHVFAPIGMQEEDFLDRAEQAFTKSAKDAGLPDSVVNGFDRLSLDQVGERSYHITNGRSFVLDPKTGQPLIINIPDGRAQ